MSLFKRKKALSEDALRETKGKGTQLLRRLLIMSIIGLIYAGVGFFIAWHLVFYSFKCSHGYTHIPLLKL